MDNRKRGDDFEKVIAKLLNMHQTANSGAMNDDADLRPCNGKPVILEAKVKNTSHAFLSDVRCEIQKLTEQANKIGKDWIYVVRDCQGGAYAICSLDFFSEVTEDYFGDDKERDRR